MKITKLIFAFVMCLAFVFESCKNTPSVVKEVQQVPINTPHRLAVNEDFLKNRKPGEFERLIFYISADTEFNLYNNEYQDSVGIDGIYYTNTIPNFNSVLIKRNDPGKFVQNICNWKRIEIKFSDNKDILLTFARINNTNQYALDSAKLGAISIDMPTFQSDKPLLEILHISGPDPNYSAVKA
jgi:cobalamin biosynthesis Mg chelatase CobN